MSLEIWNRLEPDLCLAEHVHLQGWGEPLLHPELARLARDAAASGSEVGITTNADLVLDRGRWLADGAVSIVTLSLAGVAETHTEWRDGGTSETVWTALDFLASHRRRNHPRLQVSYLLTADNAADLPTAVRSAAAAGAEEVFVIHLDCTPTADHLTMAAYTDDVVPAATRRHIIDAADAARRTGIRFRPPTLEPSELLVCSLDPRRLASVTWDGRVGPCVNLTMPLRGGVPRATEAGELTVEPQFFGRLHAAPLSAILAGEARAGFIAPFEARLACETRFQEQTASLGWGPPALRRLEQVDRQRSEELDRWPFPTACRGCHKAVGW